MEKESTNTENSMSIDNETKLPVSCSLRVVNNKIDLAYFCGVFNVSSIDGLQKEINRLKKIGKKPHQIFDIRNDAKLPVSDVFSLEEAKTLAIVHGKKIRHKYFLDHEYILFDGGWKTEDGYDLPDAYFIGMDENWQTGWSEHIA